MKQVYVVGMIVMAAAWSCAAMTFGTKVGIPAPAIVYSLTVRNQRPVPVEVRVTFRRTTDGEEIVDTAVIGTGESKFFDTRTYEEGAAKFMYVIGNVAAVSLAGDGEEVSVSAPFDVHSPTKNYVMVVANDASNGRMTLTHASKVDAADE